MSDKIRNVLTCEVPLRKILDNSSMRKIKKRIPNHQDKQTSIKENVH